MSAPAAKTTWPLGYPTNLRGYWPLDDSDPAADLSGNGNNGTTVVAGPI